MKTRRNRDKRKDTDSVNNTTILLLKLNCLNLNRQYYSTTLREISASTKLNAQDFGNVNQFPIYIYELYISLLVKAYELFIVYSKILREICIAIFSPLQNFNRTIFFYWNIKYHTHIIFNTI